MRPNRLFAKIACNATLGCAALVLAVPAHGQLGGLLDKIIPPGLRASDAANAPPAPTPSKPDTTVAPGTTSAVLAGEAPPVGPKKNIEPEMQPDINCNRPRERFNIGEKVLDYGGTAAALRLERLVQTDYKYSDLKPEDEAMLKYLAQTTVWVPPGIESRLGSIYTLATGRFGSGNKLSELEQAALQTVEARLKVLKGAVADFPADIQLSVDKSLPDGAFSKFGGVIQISERFLTGGLTERPEGGDFVLAHEMSHVYKRHAVKDMQFKLISSNEGWDLTRKVLQRAQRGLALDPIADGLFVLGTVPKLIDFVRSMQLKFNRDQELEADACSTVWLKDIGVDPIAAWDAYRATVGANADNPASYSASHPTTPEREARFKRKAAGHPMPAGQGSGKRQEVPPVKR